MTISTTVTMPPRRRKTQHPETAGTRSLERAVRAAAPPELARDCFAALGAYGFANIQIAILASLVSEDPLLLIGPSGTGKTHLLNTISEALGLEHRHYNASLIAFDDLVGFPYPDDARETVRFLQTPATIWGAESVLVDEISRCKPEHQNRLFSLIHERRIQGIALGRLRYRWAAMNPCTADQAGGEYLGSEPLDPALADRFAVLVEVSDWEQLSEAEQRKVSDPGGEGRIAVDTGDLKSSIADWRHRFEAALEECPVPITEYACACANALLEGGVRISPRRVRLFSRTLLAASIIEGGPLERSFKTILECSIPHRGWGEPPDPAKIAAAHRLAWEATLLTGDAQWAHRFHLKRTLASKVRYLAETCPSPDTGTLAVEQLLANAPPEQVAAFALAVYPAAVAGRLPIGADGVADLGKAAASLLDVCGEIRWQERLAETGTAHPELTRLAAILERLSPVPRKHRARQLFYWSLVNAVQLPDPARLEGDLNRVVEYLSRKSAT